MSPRGPVAGAVLAALLASSGCVHLRPPEHLPLGAPFRLAVTDLRGHRTVLRGTPGKVTVVVFWASWCARVSRASPTPGASPPWTPTPRWWR